MLNPLNPFNPLHALNPLNLLNPLSAFPAATYIILIPPPFLLTLSLIHI